MLIFGYLLGSIQFGIILTKIISGKDPRDFGSGNSGGTNVGRVLGKKWGVVTILLDMLKTIIAFLGAYFLVNLLLNPLFLENFNQELWDGGVLFYYLAPLGSALGHCYPLFYKFKGGKTVSCFSGFAIITSWFEFALGLFTYFFTKKKSGYVSLASMIMGASTAVVSWIMAIIAMTVAAPYNHLGMWGWGYFALAGWEHASVTTIISLILIIRHIPNIKRLKEGNENKAVSPQK